ncbi:NAD-dependent epimerase/dehydratase family protein [Parahaliea mediterranea]|uniref:NAD-dependent epimerase/dehydratase family protein n=1 Tax=Parahaliea mediterranea TaxID=651086 RepID=UPI00130031AF|nr:NAD-dependent epimerase/dehydratase family protein [Parahaliea mediterranea]
MGASGFIGHALCSRLKGMRSVYALTRHQPAKPIAGVNYITGGVEAATDLGNVLSTCGCVVYTASSSTPGSSAGKPVDEIEQHLRPLSILLQQLQFEAPPHLIYLSSAGATYGNVTGKPFVEADLPRPASYHGATKFAAEMLITAWAHQYKGKATVFRPSNVYGPGQQTRQGFGIIPAALSAQQQNKTLEIWGDGSAIRDYLYIDDLITLLSKAIDDGGSPGTSTFNASSGDCVSLNQLLDIIAGIGGLGLNLRFKPARAVDASEVRFDSTKTQQHFNWQPKYTLSTGLQATWEWINNSAH